MNISINTHGIVGFTYGAKCLPWKCDLKLFVNMIIISFMMCVSCGCSSKTYGNKTAVPIPGTSHSLSLPSSYEVFVDDGTRPNHRYALCANTLLILIADSDLGKSYVGLNYRIGSLNEYDCIIGKGSMVDNRTHWSSLPHDIDSTEGGIVVKSFADWVLIIDHSLGLVSMISVISKNPLETDKTNMEVCLSLYNSIITDK